METRILSKYSACWNSRALIRCAGRRVISRGRRFETGLGRGEEEMKLFDWEGTVEEDEKSRLYVDMLMFVSKGL